MQDRINAPHIHVVFPGHSILVPYMSMLECHMEKYSPQGVRADKKGYYLIFENTPKGREDAAECQRAYNGKRFHDSKYVMELFN